MNRPKANKGRERRKKIGRNDPCPCGSGKKFKHCHGEPAHGPSLNHDRLEDDSAKEASVERPETQDFDARDFARGVKRSAKDFRRMLYKTLDTANIETTKLFDDAHRADIQAILHHLSFGYESVNAIGLHRSASKPQHLEQSFFLFHEALNLVLVALRTIRGGSIIASDGILRQALELACVGYQIAADASGRSISEFLQGKLHAPKAISIAKKIYEPIGRLYGNLSASAVHASVEHLRHSISSDADTGRGPRIHVGAAFDPGHDQRFKLGLIRIERVSVAVLALIEAGFFNFLEAPRLWKKTPAGLERSHDQDLENRLRKLDTDQDAIDNPYTIVYPWVDPQDQVEVRELLGTIKGPGIEDVERLRSLSQAHPESFVIHYLLGAALQGVSHFVGAASEFEQAWKLRPDGYDVWMRLETIYRESGEPGLLEDFYKRSIERDSEDYIAHHNLGMLYARTGQHERAFECFQRAHSLKPERYQPIFNGAKALVRLGRYDQALDCYRHAAEREPNNPDPWHSAGDVTGLN